MKLREELLSSYGHAIIPRAILHKLKFGILKTKLWNSAIVLKQQRLIMYAFYNQYTVRNSNWPTPMAHRDRQQVAQLGLDSSIITFALGIHKFWGAFKSSFHLSTRKKENLDQCDNKN